MSLYKNVNISLNIMCERFDIRGVFHRYSFGWIDCLVECALCQLVFCHVLCCLLSAKDTVYHISDDQPGVVEQQEKHGLFSWFRKDEKVLKALFGIR